MEFPNPDTQFKPGQSGNPNGRPKGTKNLSTILKTILEEEIEDDGEKRTFQEAIIRKLLKKAKDGDIKAIMEIFDRVEGKAKQEVQADITHRVIEYANGNPIED